MAGMRVPSASSIDEPAPAQLGHALLDAEQAARGDAAEEHDELRLQISSIWRSRNGWQAAISAWVGDRLPGGRQ